LHWLKFKYGHSAIKTSFSFFFCIIVSQIQSQCMTEDLIKLLNYLTHWDKCYMQEQIVTVSSFIKLMDVNEIYMYCHWVCRALSWGVHFPWNLSDLYTSMSTERSFSRSKVARGVKLTTHFHVVPRSRMVDLYLHSPMSSWHSIRLIKQRENFTLSA
jgi:hypothetical protein